MAAFSVGDNKLQSNEDKILLLSPHHSPHKVKAMHLHTGFFFIVTTGQERTMKGWGKKHQHCKRGRDTEGEEENDKTKVHFEKRLPRDKEEKEQTGHYSVWQVQKLGTHYTARTEPTQEGTVSQATSHQPNRALRNYQH